MPQALRICSNPLGHREPTVRQIGTEAGKAFTPGLRLDAGDRRQFVPEDFEVARQDRLVHINEERLRPGRYRVGTGWAHEPTVPEHALRRSWKPEPWLTPDS